MKTLIIVDPQNDFVTGSLAVPGALEAMKNLAKDMTNYDRLIITMDWHPFDHYSFLPDGIWPSHCVQYTWGSAICPEISDTLIRSFKDLDMFGIVTKGAVYNIEEYGAFDPQLPSRSGNEYIWKLECMVEDKANPIYVAGIAGDYCVYHTVKNLIALGYSNITILKDCVASIDGGIKLDELIKENNLHVIP